MGWPSNLRQRCCCRASTAHYLTRIDVPAEQHAHMPDSRGGRRRRRPGRADGKGSRGPGHRDRVAPRRRRERFRALGADHAIIYTEQDFEAEVQAPDRRRRGPRGVRLGRPHDVRQEPEGAAPARDARAVRPVERAGRPGRSADAQCRVAVSDPSQPRPLHRPAGRAPLARRRGVRPGGKRRIEGADLGVPIRWRRRARRIGTSRRARRTGSCS